MAFFYEIMTIASVSWMASMGIGLLAGYGGLLTIMQATFIGVGAFAYGRLTEVTRISPIVLVFCSVLITVGVAVVLGLILLRVEEEEFVIGTLGAQIGLLAVFAQGGALTNGVFGVANIPSPFSLTEGELAIVTVIIGVCFALIISYWGRSPKGLVARSIRDDPIAATAYGVPVWRYRYFIFLVSACLAGLAGAIYAMSYSFIVPEDFNLTWAIQLLIIVLLGGATSSIGIAFAASLLIAGPQCLIFIQVPTSLIGSVQNLFTGGLLMVAVLVRPAGLFPDPRLRRSMRLHENEYSG
jgi:ABC-type branched-subunit amino acid transport system permease subunit